MADPWLFFTPATAVTFRAAAACILPSEPGSPGADSDAALRLADRVLSERPARDRRLLGTFLGALEFLPLLRYGRKFSRLDRGRQEGVLRWLESNRLSAKLRQGFFGVKTFALMGYYGHPDTWAEIGYPGPRMDAPFYTRANQGAPDDGT